MNRIIIYFFVSIALTSCAEENNILDTEPLNQSYIETQSPNILGNNLKSATYTTYHDDGTSWGCYGDPSNCMPEVTVFALSNASRFFFWFEIFFEVMGYFGWPGGYPDVSPYHPISPDPYVITNPPFAVEYDYFCNLFSKELVDGVLDNTYSLSVRISVTENNTIGTNYFIFTNNRSDIVAVYPINLVLLDEDE